LKSAPPHTPPRALTYEVIGVVTLAIGALLLYNARLQTQEIQGGIPYILIGTLRSLFGVGAILIPVLMCLLGVVLIARHHRANLRAFWRGATLSLLIVLTAVHLQVPHGREFVDTQTLASHGGRLGGSLAWLLRGALGEVGAVICLVALSLVALLFWSELSLAQSGARVASWVRNSNRFLQDWSEQRHEARQARREERLEGDWQDPHEQETPAGMPSLKRARTLPPEIVQEVQSLGNEPDQTSSATRRPLFLSVDELLGQEKTLEAEAGKTPEPHPTTTEQPRIEFTDAPPPVSVLDSAPNPVLETPILDVPLQPKSKTI
jgi:S-DNA-T family DNA segregation ATPase FtsK/SpoIIIE